MKVRTVSFDLEHGGEIYSVVFRRGEGAKATYSVSAWKGVGLLYRWEESRRFTPSQAAAIVFLKAALKPA